MQPLTTSSHSFRNYLQYHAETTDYLLGRLSEVVTELSNLYEELAMVEAGNIRDRARILQSCGETSSNARRDRVNMEVVEGPATALELAGTRDALVEEKWFIVRLLDSRRTT